MSGMKALLDRLCEAVESEARTAGKRNAGWFVSAHMTGCQAQKLLTGIRDGDPMVMDTLPTWDAYDEATNPSADGYDRERVWEIARDAAKRESVDIGEYDTESFTLETLISYFESGWNEAAAHEVESDAAYRAEDCSYGHCRDCAPDVTTDDQDDDQ